MLQIAALCMMAVGYIPPIGNFTMKSSHINMRLPSGPLDHKVEIHYPEDLTKGPYPLVSFAHGMLAGGPTARPVYHHLMKHIVSRGIIVVAPESCLLAYCFNFYEDQLTAINATHNTSLHEVFQYVDTKSVGVVGHSMGGEATEHSSTHEGYGIKVAAAVHPVSKASFTKDAKVPILFTTGNLDVQAPSRDVKKAYEAAPMPDTYFVDLKGASHYEPTDFTEGRMDVFTSLYLHCHLTGNKESCDTFHDNICGAYTYVNCTHK